MPLFFFIFGVLFARSITRGPFSFWSYLKKRSYRILLPYFTISTVAFFIKPPFADYAQRPLSFTLVSYLQMLVFIQKNVVRFFWFLPVIFVCGLLACGTIIVYEQRHFIYLVMISIIICSLHFLIPVSGVIFGIDKALNMFVFLWIGMISYKYRKHIINYLNPYYMILFLLVLLFLNMIYLYAPWGHVCLKPIMFFAGCSGIVFSCGLSRFLCMKNVSSFNFINGFSYQIFLLSWFFSVPIRIIYELGALDFYLATFLRLFFGLVGPLLVARFFMKHVSFVRPFIGLKGSEMLKNS